MIEERSPLFVAEIGPHLLSNDANVVQYVCDIHFSQHLLVSFHLHYAIPAPCFVAPTAFAVHFEMQAEYTAALSLEALKIFI